MRFYETDEITEDAFDALVAAQPTLSSRNWPDAVTPADPANPSNRPDLDQSQFDTINISSLKFFVDEIRIGTTFDDIVGIAGPQGVPGDLNGDNVVDAADYIILKSNFGNAPSVQGEDGDLNGDNIIDAADLALFAGDINAATGTAIPEPTTLALLTLGGLAVVRRRRRS